MNTSSVSIELALVGDDFDIHYVSQKLGIDPTNTRSKDEVLGNGRKFGHTEWSIEIEREASLDIENQYGKIMSMVQSKTDLLVQLCSECDAEWHILFVIYVENGAVPGMYLSTEFIAFSAAIGAQIGLDTYVLSVNEDGYRKGLE